MADQLREVHLEKGVSTKKLKEQASKKDSVKSRTLEYRENQHEDPDILRRMKKG